MFAWTCIIHVPRRNLLVHLQTSRRVSPQAAASPAGLMKPVNLAAQLAAAETELACLKMALAQVKEDRNELRQARDDWRREAEKLYAEKLIDAKLAKLREADERRFAPSEQPSGRALGGIGWLASPSARPKTASALENDRGRQWEMHWPRRKGCQFR